MGRRYTKIMPGVEIILASASPRRRQLLAALGVRFEVAAADVPELDAATSPGLGPVQLARENGRRKAAAAARLRPGRWVLGADTVVVHDGRVFGKPASVEEAREFLKALSGRSHAVVTGCALIAPDGREEIFHAVSNVVFRELSDEIIGRYLAEVSVLDKAGAYALQERGEWIIESVTGSRDNVIGLPTELLHQVFKKCGLL
jgi:septum formation protein